MYLTVPVAVRISGGGGGSGSGSGGGTSADTTTRNVTLDAMPTGTLGITKSALNVPSVAVWSGGRPSSRNGMFCCERNDPTTVTLVKAPKFPTATKTELVVSVMKMLPFGGVTLRVGGGGVWPDTGQGKIQHTELVRRTPNSEISGHLFSQMETIDLEFAFDTVKNCHQARPDGAPLAAEARMDLHNLAESMPDKPTGFRTPLTVREPHSSCSGRIGAMMATIWRDGNERLDAHLHGEFVNESIGSLSDSGGKARGAAGRTPPQSF